jgi:nucleotide-binding universal stress UspA family protein
LTWSTIVVGTDGSERAGRAVSHAGALAAAFSAELFVVSAYGGARGRPDPGALPAELEWTATAAGRAQEMAAAGAELARAAGADRVRPIGMAGEPLEVLNAVAAERDADLIVVGSRGMRGASRFVTGSVPNELTHHALCDVLVVQTD